MLRKIVTITSSLMLATTLISCSSEEELEEVDVNGLTISEACEEVRAAGWRVNEVRGNNNYDETSDCTDTERRVVGSMFVSDRVTLYFANEPAPDTDSETEDPPVEEAPPAEEAPESDEAPEEEVIPLLDDAPVLGQGGGYQEIYDEYAARLENECPTLSMSECAELSNEGVSEMADYMYRASGTDGQYETYETWAGKLYDVYMESVR